MFEGGTSANGDAGDEALQTAGTTTGNKNTVSLSLTQNQPYAFALAFKEDYGGSGFLPKVEAPNGSFVTIDPLDAGQDGWFTSKKLAGNDGLNIWDQVNLETNGTNLISGRTYYYRVRGTNSQGTDWADSTASFVSERALDSSTGTLTFNTNGPTPSWSSTSGTGGTGQLVSHSYTDASSNLISYQVAQYDFNRVNIGDGVNVVLHGSNPLFLNVTGDATILADLDANGTEGFYVHNVETVVPGKLGGGYGGHEVITSSGPGGGPAHLTSADPFNSGGAPFKGYGNLAPTTLIAGKPAGGGILRRNWRTTGTRGRTDRRVYHFSLRKNLRGCRYHSPVRWFRRRGWRSERGRFRRRCHQGRGQRHPHDRRQSLGSRREGRNRGQ